MDEVPSEGLPGGHPGSTLESVEQALCSAAAIRGPHGAPAGDDCEDAASAERRAGADSPRGPAHPGTHHRAPRPGSSRPLRGLAERGTAPCGAGWTCAARPEASPKGRHGVGGARLWSSELGLDATRKQRSQAARTRARGGSRTCRRPLPAGYGHSGRALPSRASSARRSFRARPRR